MVNSPRSQVWILVAITGMISQTLVMLADDPGWVSILAVGIAALVGLFLFRGSRVAWSIAVISAGGQCVEAILANRPVWVGAVNAVVLLCLFVPPSLAFVWREGALVKRSRTANQGEIRQKAHELLYRSLALAAGWEASVEGKDHSRPSKSYRNLMWRLGLLTLLLLLLVGATYNWQQETGNNVVLNVVADIVWTVYAVVQIAFLVVVSIAAVRHFGSSRSDATQKS